MPRLMKDLLAQRAAEYFVGREEELAILLQTLEEDGPPIVYLHGIAGVGKSSLLDAFTAQARARGAQVASLDCRSIEPTERGFLQEVGAAIGADPQSARDAADRLGQLGERVILTLDTYELFRLLDTWLRQEFVPALRENVRIVFSGRESPVAAWLVSPGWQGLVRSVHLGPLHRAEAVELLAHAGVGEQNAQQVNQLARGHPLALTLAASAMIERADLDLDGIAAQRVIEDLTQVFLADVPDPVTRRSLEASSVVRRVTVSVLHAMLPDVSPVDALDRLRALPFVEGGRDGLVVHDAVRQAIASRLQSVDPTTHRDYRRAAWQQLRTEVRSVGKAEMWRYTADMLYIIENPVIREAFFPSDAHLYAVEPARPEDELAILEMSERHDGVAVAAHVRRWWRAMPQSFNTVRDGTEEPAGYYQMFVAGDATPELLRQDPITANWWRHLRTHPVPKGQQALFFRRWLNRDNGEAPSPVQAASWLDAKRAYMELRPDLRRVYTALRDLPTFAPVAQRLGFQPLNQGVVEIDGSAYYSAVLDFGPASIDGWLAGLVAAELGMDDPSVLDSGAHELVVDGRRVGLTPLEFAVMQYLVEHDGKAVPRGDLLEDVWGAGYIGGSNVVDVVVRSLRKKLGAQATSLETVRGVGYRLRAG